MNGAMIRPAWQSPLYSQSDSSDHLQSDVMRFMAILAFCLVAIFALVQSIPPQPVPAIEKPAEPETRAEMPQPVEPTPIAKISPPKEPEQQGLNQRLVIKKQPLPKPMPLPQPIKPEPSKPEPIKPEPIRVKPEPVPIKPKPQPSLPETKVQEPASQEGFALRFASDTALLALVAQRKVEVFGWSGEQAWKLSSQRGLLEFAPATAPRSFHHMAPATVSAPIVAAFSDTAEVSGAMPVTWGVTLPPDMSRQLQRLLREQDGGTLLIHANGSVRREGKG